MFATLNDPQSQDQLLSTLNITDEEKIINISEKGDVDAHFIISHLVKQISQEKNKVCLLHFHNNFKHYQVTGSRFGVSVNIMIRENKMKVIDALSAISEQLVKENSLDLDRYLETCCTQLMEAVADLSTGDETLYIIIEDVSHLLDLGVEVKWVLNFLNYCVNLMTDKTRLVISSHVASKTDAVISNYLAYVSDVNIELAELKTGKSVDVAGHLYVERPGKFMTARKEYLFRNYERGTKVFLPGESVFNLRR